MRRQIQREPRQSPLLRKPFVAWLRHPHPWHRWRRPRAVVLATMLATRRQQHHYCTCGAHRRPSRPVLEDPRPKLASAARHAPLACSPCPQGVWHVCQRGAHSRMVSAPVHASQPSMPPAVGCLRWRGLRQRRRDQPRCRASGAKLAEQHPCDEPPGR